MLLREGMEVVRQRAFDYFGNGRSERNAAFTYGYDLWVNEAVELLIALETGAPARAG